MNNILHTINELSSIERKLVKELTEGLSHFSLKTGIKVDIAMGSTTFEKDGEIVYFYEIQKIMTKNKENDLLILLRDEWDNDQYPDDSDALQKNIKHNTIVKAIFDELYDTIQALTKFYGKKPDIDIFAFILGVYQSP